MAPPKTMRQLTGGGLTLEPQTAAHAAELYAAISDPELYRYIDQKAPASEAALAERLLRLESRLSGDGTEHWLNWIVRNAEGELAGYVQATVSPNRKAEVAYVFGRHYWRRGYATAACRLMLAELADHYGVVGVTATLDPGNAASVGLLRKLGFEFVEANGAEHEVVYGRPIYPKILRTM